MRKMQAITKKPLEAGSKLPYSPPKLETYGSVVELTRQNGPGPASDKGLNRMGFFSG